jgi:23S rRNA (pseudouridine1915-N3)-methyltransferase
MRIKILSIGKKTEGRAISTLIADYMQKTPWKIETEEFFIAHLDVTVRMKKEGEMLLAHIPSGAIVIALDATGRQFTSKEFSQKIAQYQMQNPNICFIIGGAYGLSNEVKSKSHLSLSLGKMIYPHKIAQLLIAEQIYRAYCILHNHPYHK